MDGFNEIIGQAKPTLVDFYATWCGPCKMQAPILEQIKVRFGDRINVIKIDVDKNPDLSRQYQVRSIPTLILFRKGVPEWRGYGLHQADLLEAKINGYLGE